MKNILVVDDIPSKVAHLKELENSNCTVTFVDSFKEARKILKFNPNTYDKIYLDHDLDNGHTGIELLQFFIFDKGLKPGCRIIANSASEKCNFKIKSEIVRLKLTRKDTLN